MCIERWAILKFSENLNPKEFSHHKEDLISIRRFCIFVSKFGLCPFIKNTAWLIWTALSAPKVYCIDTATIDSCFLFDKYDKRELNLD